MAIAYHPPVHRHDLAQATNHEKFTNWAVLSSKRAPNLHAIRFWNGLSTVFRTQFSKTGRHHFGAKTVIFSYLERAGLDRNRTIVRKERRPRSAVDRPETHPCGADGGTPPLLESRYCSRTPRMAARLRERFSGSPVHAEKRECRRWRSPLDCPTRRPSSCGRIASTVGTWREALVEPTSALAELPPGLITYAVGGGDDVWSPDFEATWPGAAPF